MSEDVLITIRATPPRDNDDATHEAIVGAKPHVAKIVEALTELGFTDIDATRRTVRRKDKPAPGTVTDIAARDRLAAE